ncbi:MAG: DUF4956 domain-containing protein, partial [Anaerovorax sp.]
MREYILNFFEQSQTVTLQQVAFHILAAVIIGLAVYISYWISHTGTVYSKKFNVSLIMLTVLTATVMTVIGNNVALSLGMVGALSIVRFRTAIKDSRDTAYIFWAIVGGICCGAGDYMIATIGSTAIFILLLILGRVKNDNRILLIIRADRNVEMEVEGTVFQVFQRTAKMRVKNTTPESTEYIYEISRKMYENTIKTGNSITDLLYDKGNIQYVNV